MTPYSVIYDAFKAKILEDEWINWDKEKELMDLRAILEVAISRFKFPRKSLERNDQGYRLIVSIADVEFFELFDVFTLGF